MPGGYEALQAIYLEGVLSAISYSQVAHNGAITTSLVQDVLAPPPSGTGQPAISTADAVAITHALNNRYGSIQNFTLSVQGQGLSAYSIQDMTNGRYKVVFDGTDNGNLLEALKDYSTYNEVIGGYLDPLDIFPAGLMDDLQLQIDAAISYVEVTVDQVMNDNPGNPRRGFSTHRPNRSFSWGISRGKAPGSLPRATGVANRLLRAADIQRASRQSYFGAH